MVTYGLHADADVRAVNIRRELARTAFDVMRRGRSGALRDAEHGRAPHVRNALAAIAVTTELEISDERSRAR